ncbi:MAG: hypothetical protein H6Q69_502 [Firmicutes bacterium]|nr:hypothetical protein [Bacillota bacterium]
MEVLFEGLTSSEIEYLKYLQECGYYDGFEMFMNLDTSADYRVEKLTKGNYISLDDGSHKGGKSKITVTGKGIAALIDFDKYQNQIQPINEQMQILKSLADSHEKQVILAEQTAKDSKHESSISKTTAIISIIIALLAILADLLPFIYDLIKPL